jgi:hypothetical protein
MILGAERGRKAAATLLALSMVQMTEGWQIGGVYEERKGRACKIVR